MKKVFYTAIAILGFVNLTMAQVPSYVPTNGLVGFWPFNGNANDASGNGNNGTVNGATLTTDRFGNTNMAYNFNNTQIRVNNIANSQFINNFTVSVWVYLDTLSSNINYPTFIESENSGIVMQAEIYPLGSSPKYLSYFLINHNIPGQQQEDGHVNGNAGYNNWQHVVLRNFNKINYLYINGQLVDTSNSQSNKQGVQLGSYLKFGNGDNLPLEKFIGRLDDIGIWNRALTESEIKALYNANFCFEKISVTDTLIINVNRTGYNPIIFENTLKVYPNPAKDKITIDNGNLTKMTGYSIKIMNSLGQQVFQNTINQQQFNIDITAWGGNGMYFLQLIDKSGNIVDVKKILLN